MADKKDFRIVKGSREEKYAMIEHNERYKFVDNTGDECDLVYTPGGMTLQTAYLPLAEKIFDDLFEYGIDQMSAESILPWHYTLCDNFAEMEHKDIEDMLDACFLQKDDWTFLCRHKGETMELFGTQLERNNEIRSWLSRCTHMQLAAACSIGNAYQSLNIAFILASMMENYPEKERRSQFRRFAKFIDDHSFNGPVESILDVFENFNLYYGFHLEENGKIINKTSVGIEIDEDLEAMFHSFAEELLDSLIIDIPNADDIFDVIKLCDEIKEFCINKYTDNAKLKQEFFISAYYAAICLTIHNIQDGNSFSKENAYHFLQTKCDVEFTDIYSDRLLGYKTDDEDSENIWQIFRPYLSEVFAVAKDHDGFSDELIHAAMKSAITMGIAVGQEFYEPVVLNESAYIGTHIDVNALIGRNFYHYVNGIVVNEQPFVLKTEDIETDEDSNSFDIIEEEHDFSKASLSAFVAKECWIKKKSGSENTIKGNHLIVIELDQNSNIIDVSEVLEEVQHICGGMLLIPGMELPARKEYSVQEELSEETMKELELLINKRIVPNNFSFVGKKIPQAMIDKGGNGGDNTNYTYALQSAYRQAYMHMSIDTTEEGIIEEFEYSTYQSTGSGYWDMFSRPSCISDKHEEVVDMLLYLIDLYTDEEYCKLRV